MQATETLTLLPAGNPFDVSILLDEQGREIPITEEMILKACNELIKLCEFPRKVAA